MYRNWLKRLIDILIAAGMLLGLAPALLTLSLIVLLKLGHPIFFKQQRPGLHAKAFTIYKFRTMTQTVDAMGNLQADHQRLTTFGTFLRSTSLDELPELFNVLKGDMSLVGPRPLLMKYLNLYTPEQAKRHDIRPGITGWAQINGRNSISWEEKFAYDVWYVENYSLLLDLKILILTLGQVLLKKDINAENQSTMSEFTGTD